MERRAEASLACARCSRRCHRRWSRSPAASTRASCCAWRTRSSATAARRSRPVSPTTPAGRPRRRRPSRRGARRHARRGGRPTSSRFPGYAENPIDRCYFCKDNLFVDLRGGGRASAASRRSSTARTSTTCSDHRPGLARRRRARRPASARRSGLHARTTIRAASRTLGLATWDRPASPCLSSRFPYGTHDHTRGARRVSPPRRMSCAGSGSASCACGYHDRVARIEVPGRGDGGGCSIRPCASGSPRAQARSASLRSRSTSRASAAAA